MRDWTLSLPLESDAGVPRFLQIARAVVAEIRRGRLRPDEALPSSRALATRLGVHRNTVLAAYAELTAEGWIRTERARGTFVSDALPAMAPAPRPRARRGPGFTLPRAPIGAPASRLRAPIAMVGGLPDLRLVPAAELGRAYRRALARRRGALLDYGDPTGLPALREALARMLARTRGVVTEPDGLMVTRGSQMALYLVAQVLLRPGAHVAVEGYGYAPAWDALTLAGARLVPVDVDRHGLSLTALEALSERTPLAAIYVTPHHQYPTTATLSAGRRERLLALARRRRIAIIEDDYDHEFHYEGKPVLPLASADPHGVVIYVGTLSKVLAPGLRLGYVAGPRELVAAMASLRARIDTLGDPVGEWALAELLEEGAIERHAHRMRRVYRSRRDALVAALERSLAERLTFDVPPGGMALWAKARGRLDVDAWAERALAHGVGFAPASRFTFGGARAPFVRLGFAAVTEAEIEQGVGVLARTIDRR